MQQPQMQAILVVAVEFRIGAMLLDDEDVDPQPQDRVQRQRLDGAEAGVVDGERHPASGPAQDGAGPAPGLRDRGLAHRRGVGRGQRAVRGPEAQAERQ